MDENCTFVTKCTDYDGKLIQSGSVNCRDRKLSEELVKKGEEILEKNGMPKNSYDISNENC